MVEWEQLRIGRSEHAFVVGLTGCGKSELARRLLDDPDKKFSIVYDPKHTDTFSAWQEQTFIYSWQELITSKARRIVYRPSKAAYWGRDGKLTNEAEDPDAQDRFFQFVFATERRRLCVDEAAALPGGAHPSYHLRQCLTQGRELGISCVCLTQRPASVPIHMMSEARKVFLFRLNMKEDRKRMEEITGFTCEQQGTLQEFEFFCYDFKLGRYPRKIKLNLSRIARSVESGSLTRVPRPLFGVSSYLEGGTNGG
jgi:hypothetical protein